MTRPSTPPILSELQSSSSPAGQVAALRALKNEVIGHEQKKEMWIGLGVLTSIARILNSHKGSGKKRNRDTNGSRHRSERRQIRTDEEESRLQAIIIVGSLAHGGPAYISPLNAGFVIAPLLAVLSPTEFSPVVILAALRSLNSVADSVSLEHSLDSSDHGLLQLLYTEKHLSSITELLSQGSNSLTVQQQISLAAVLISKTCREETHRKTLAQMGVLEALATQLSSFIVATGCCLLSRGGHDYGKTHPDSLPTATTRSRLSPILEAVGTIIQNSKRRAIQFLSAPAFASIFSRTEFKDEYKLERKENERSSHLYNPSFDSLSRQDPFDALLPQVPNLHHRSSTTQKSGFPPLGTIAISGKQYQASRTFFSAVEVLQNQDCEYAGEEESPLIAWLFYSARAESGITRLMAARVLAMFYRFGLANRRKETGFRMLLVPLLARMLDKESKTSPEAPNQYDSSVLRSSDWIIKEQAPAVLAMLAVDNVHLRRAAVDAGAIKKLSQLLKESYDPLPTTFSISLWTPAPMDPENPSSKANASKLGVAGFSPLAYHIMRVREEVLIALAAIASLEDEHRKAIIDNGVVPFVIESLKPFGATPSSSSIPKTQSEEIKNRTVLLGNPSPVILAACGAARMLSRSVSTLRTSLMDAGLAPPLFDLLRYQNMDIQIAATAVICNLLLEFSPMREVIIDAGILTILCEHAHSMNVGLRLNSIWALKHLVHTAPKSLKMACLEELGPGWLKQIISSDDEESAFTSVFRGDKEMGSGTPIAMGTPNAAGEQVDLLNAVEEDSRKSNQQFDENGDEDLKMVDSIGALSRSESDHKQLSPFSRRGNGRAAKTESPRPIGSKDTEINLLHQARTDDLAVQKQGLDLIRNLICAPDALDMIDYLFRELGQDKIFDMLAGKLRPKVLNAFNRDKRSAENGVRHLQPHPEIVASVCYIINNIAAGPPKHRQLLISQTELMKLLVPLFSHTNREVRACCAWIVINLTWADESLDKPNCKIRARELFKLGAYEKLEALESDPDIDVRERTKTAIHHMRELLK